jgi:hypothetical protein
MMNNIRSRISSLPNEVMSHILFFLRTQEAVQTCIFPERWEKYGPFCQFSSSISRIGLMCVAAGDEEELAEGEEKFEECLNVNIFKIESEYSCSISSCGVA